MRLKNKNSFCIKHRFVSVLQPEPDNIKRTILYYPILIAFFFFLLSSSRTAVTVAAFIVRILCLNARSNYCHLPFRFFFFFYIIQALHSHVGHAWNFKGLNNKDNSRLSFSFLLLLFHLIIFTVRLFQCRRNRRLTYRHLVTIVKKATRIY